MGLKDINIIIVSASTDGMATSAAILRYIDDINCSVIIKRPKDLLNIDINSWQKDRKIIFINFAVSSVVNMVTFFKAVYALGHSVVSVIDEHDADKWSDVFNKVGISANDLSIFPVSQDKSDVKSSGSLLLKSINDLDGHSIALCKAADAADKMEFSKNNIASYFNKSVKINPGDVRRRKYLIKYFAKNLEPNEKIKRWIDIYDNEIVKNNEIVLDNKINHGSGFVEITPNRKVDMTLLCKSLFDSGFEVIYIKYHNSFLIRNKYRFKFPVADILERNNIPVVRVISKARIDMRFKKRSLSILKQELAMYKN